MKTRFIFLAICIFVLMSGCNSRNHEDGYSDGFASGYQAGFQAALSTMPETIPSTVAQETTMETEEVSQKPFPEPENGFLFSDITDQGFGTATLKVQSSGSGGYYLVVKPIKFSGSFTESWRNTALELQAKYSSVQFYVRSYSTVEVEVPLGEYKIYFAQGDTWYGETELFGEETQFFKCDKTFLFEKNTSGENGWTVSLSPVQNGNLNIYSIDEADFPRS